MRWFPLMLLLVPQDEKPLETFTDRVGKARTVRTEVTVSVNAGGEERGMMRCRMALKGDSQWSLSVETKSRDKTDDRKWSVLCDGSRIVVVEGDVPSLESQDPKKLAGWLRSSLGTSMLAMFMMLYRENPDSDPEISDVKDGGATTLDGKDARLIEYTLHYGGGSGIDRVPAKLWLTPDGSAPLRRELSIENVVWLEKYESFELNAEIPDSEFRFQSKRRMAAARCRQLAHAVGLFTRYTGRPPERLEDLVKRPAWLDQDIFWPSSGFWIQDLPKDFVLSKEKDRLKIASSGEEAAYATLGNRSAICAPDETLRSHFDARVRIHLLAALVRAFRDTYGELPRKKAVLWERPAWADVWPEGGWLARIPDDPWGDPYRIITESGYVRIQVHDPKARRLSIQQLTADELRALNDGARPRLSEKERLSIHEAIDRLKDDDLEIRESAEIELGSWGTAILPLLRERLKAERDSETAARLEQILRKTPEPPPAWKAELRGLSEIVPLRDGAARILTSNERNASGTLKTFATAQADFRSNDRDNNRVNDFWTGDIAGLYAIEAGGATIKLIEVSAALADEEPLEAGKVKCYPKAIATYGVPSAKAGYKFRTLREDLSCGVKYAQDTDDSGEKVRNTSRFGACAFPEEYGVGGTKTFIINEGNTLFWKDTGGEPVLDWPTDEDLAAEWQVMD